MRLEEAVGLAVRHLRQRRGWSQEELCWQAGVERAYLSGLERGVRDTRLSTLTRVADGLEAPLSRIIRLAERIADGELEVDRPLPASRQRVGQRVLPSRRRPR